MKRIVLWLTIIMLLIGGIISAFASDEIDSFYGVWIAFCPSGRV